MEKPETIESPCIMVCVIEPKSGHCHGCGRTSDEIAQWSDTTVNMRRKVMQQLPARLANIERKPRRMTKRRQMAERRKTFG